MYWHNNPLQAEDWIKQHIGENNYISLRAKAMSIKRWTLPEMEELLNTLRSL